MSEYTQNSFLGLRRDVLPEEKLFANNNKFIKFIQKNTATYLSNMSPINYLEIVYRTLKIDI